MQQQQQSETIHSTPDSHYAINILCNEIVAMLNKLPY